MAAMIGIANPGNGARAVQSGVPGLALVPALSYGDLRGRNSGEGL